MNKTVPRRAHYVQLAIWIVAGAAFTGFVVYASFYFATVRRIVVVKTVYEPPPLTGVRNVAMVRGARFPDGTERLFRPLHTIDRQWLRKKWWTEVPADVQARLGAVQN